MNGRLKRFERWTILGKMNVAYVTHFGIDCRSSNPVGADLAANTQQYMNKSSKSAKLRDECVS